MKKLVLVAALATVTACNQAEAPAETEEVEEVAVVEIMAADGQAPAGTYKVTDAEGVVFTEVLNADGTYSSSDADGNVTETGTWVQKSPETYCYTPEGKEEVCNTETIDEAGVWTSTGPDGQSVTVERVVEEAEAPAE